jgi:tetratricopeptide (TPR) repeat protein
MPAGPRALLEGKRFIDERQYAQALEQLKNAVSLLPTNAQAWNYLGLACHYSGQATEAEKAYQRALALDRNLFEAHFNYGCLLLEQSKTNLARNELTAFVLRRPQSIEGLQKLGMAQLRCREIAAAEKTFADASRLSPHSAEALNGLGLARVARNHGSDAALFFHRALKEQPGYRPALLNLAIVSHQYLKNRQFALQKYQEYLALKPSPPDAERIRVIVRQLEQELNAATRPAINPVQAKVSTVEPIPLLQSPARTTNATPVVAPIPKSIPVTIPPPAAVVPASNPPPELVKLSEEPVLQPAGDVQVSPPPAPVIADVEPNSAITSAPPVAKTDSKPPKRGFLQKVNPLNVFRPTEKVVIRPTPLPSEGGGAAPNAAVRLDSGLDLAATPGSSNWSRYVYLAPAKPAAGNRAQAELPFRQGVEAQQAKRLADAVEAYEKATNLDPSFFEAHYNLGLARTGLGRLPAALAAYEMALTIRPESLDARYNFALALKQANHVPDAIKELETMLVVAPNETRAYLALGNLYAQQVQQPVKAREYYVKLLELDARHPQSSAIRFWLAANPR